MGITNIDPLQNELLFERFLNPERVDLPDIDTDFCMNRPGRSLTTSRESTDAKTWPRSSPSAPWRAKAAIKDVGRAWTSRYNDVDRIAKMVPNTLNITIDQASKTRRNCRRRMRMRHRSRR